MPRPPRRAPKREPDPLDEYSTWNIRIARFFFNSFVVIALWVVLGVWGTILGLMIETGKMDIFLSWPLSLQIFVITAAICGHLFLLVLFYIMFKGGKLKLLKIMFKDRKVAKKYEDYQGLRLLIGVTLISVYILLISLFIWVLPLAFFELLAEFYAQLFSSLNLGQWILLIGGYAALVIFLLFFTFVILNQGVFYVLKKVKKIEEEDDVKQRIKTEELHEMSEEQLHQEYNKETGRNAIYRGKETKGYVEWKQKRL